MLTLLLAAPPIRGRVVTPDGPPVEVFVALVCRGQVREAPQETRDGGYFEFNAQPGPCVLKAHDWAGHPPIVVRCVNANVNLNGETLLTLPRLAIRGPDGSCYLPSVDGGYEPAGNRKCPVLFRCP